MVELRTCVHALMMLAAAGLLGMGIDVASATADDSKHWPGLVSISACWRPECPSFIVGWGNAVSARCHIPADSAFVIAQRGEHAVVNTA